MQKKTAGKTRHSNSSVDLEEIKPHIFLIHDSRMNSILKGEGKIAGQRFELTSWRREGLLARLRDRGFNVRTLADQVDKLPNPPRVGLPSGTMLRPLSTTIERFSYFDPDSLNWVTLEPFEHEGQKVVQLLDGAVIRRRKGRGASDYYLAFRERTGGAGLRPIDESKAILTGYGQATAQHNRDIDAKKLDKAYILPDLILPEPYRKLLARIGERIDEGWRIHQRGWPLAQEIFARLGILLRAVEAPSASTSAANSKNPTAASKAPQKGAPTPRRRVRKPSGR
jgi:hypothetical protein